MTTNLAHHTDTTADQHWTARRVLAYVLDGRDYDDRLSARELAAYVDPGESAVRDLIGDLRRDFGLAVYSRGSGYWHLQTDADLQTAIDEIHSAIETRRETIDSLRDAYHQDTVTMTRRPPAGIYARETRDTSDEYAEARIKNLDDPEYLDAMYRVESERDAPRDHRLKWVVETLTDADTLRDLAAFEADAEDVNGERLGHINRRVKELSNNE